MSTLYMVMGYFYLECNPAARVKTFIVTYDYSLAEKTLSTLLTHKSKETGFSKSHSCRDGVFWIKNAEMDNFYKQGRNMCVPDPLEKSN